MASHRKKAVSPIDVHVGQKMRARRTVLGISQTSLAMSLGVVATHVQRYEKGECRLYASQIHKLSVILDVSPAYFFNGAPEASISVAQAGDAAIEESAKFLATKNGEAVMAACSQIRDWKVRHIIRHHVEDLARALAGPFDD
jgi:transcriptional regulator with XRE-family HTH domain